MTEKTKHQILRFLDKVAEKFPDIEDPSILTDIHVRVNQETGDIFAFDDDDKEITRCVIEEWMNNSASPQHFYNKVVTELRSVIDEKQPLLGILIPYNYVLESEAGEHIEELYIVDDTDTTIIGTPFMQDLDKDLDDFIVKLLKEE